MMQLRDMKKDNRQTILAFGASGAGKTGALAPLANAGYRLHILDFDKKSSEVLRVYADASAFIDIEIPPDSNQNPLKWVEDTLYKWKKSLEEPKSIIVIDTITGFHDEMERFFTYTIRGQYWDKSGVKRQWDAYAAQQTAILNLLGITQSYPASLIAITHTTDIPLSDISGKDSVSGMVAGMQVPAIFGKALNRNIGRRFTHMVFFSIDKDGKRMAYTSQTDMPERAFVKSTTQLNIAPEKFYVEFFKKSEAQ